VPPPIRPSLTAALHRPSLTAALHRPSRTAAACHGASLTAAARPAAALRTVAVTVAAAVALAACGSVVAPPASGPRSSPGGTPRASATRSAPATRSAAAIPRPPAGNRAEAAALARLLLSRLRLPPAARRLPPDPLPPSLSQPATQYAGAPASLDQHQLFALTQPMDAAAAFLAAYVPAGLSPGGTGEGSGPSGVTMREVSDMVRSLPAGIAGAQLVLTVVPATSGGSLLRADAQVIWYPPRSAAEYIDPARYHVLSITVSVYGRRPHTVRKIVTSQMFIARLAEALDRMQAEPPGAVACPADFEDYQLSFSVSAHSRPAVVVSANESGCGGAQVTVDGRAQPALADDGTVAALVRQVVSATPEI
jgi:hypothetical protein